jgi:hypothetical protein
MAVRNPGCPFTPIAFPQQPYCNDKQCFRVITSTFDFFFVKVKSFKILEPLQKAKRLQEAMEAWTLQMLDT